MAIPTEIETALADKPDVLTFVKGLDAKAEKFTPELEKALPDLGKLGEYKASATALAKILTETKAKDADTLIKDFATVVSIKDDLLKQKKEGKLGGEGGDVTKAPEFLALQEQIADIQKKSEERIAALETESKTSKETTAKAEADRRESDLKSSILSAAAENKLRKPEDQYLLLKAKGLIGHKEDGTPFFNKLNANGEKVAVTNARELAKWIAETDKAAVDPSGKGGTGQDHKGTGGGGADAPTTVKDARRAFMTR